MAADDPRCDFSDLQGSQRIPVVSGTSRAVVNRVLYALAEAASASPYWVEIRAGKTEPEDEGPAGFGWIPSDRLFVVGDLLEAERQDAPAAVSFPLISFLRDPTAEPISAAMRLRPVPQAPGAVPGPAETRDVVAVANVERAGQLWPESPRAMQAVVRAFLRAGVVPYFSTLRPSKRREGADLVFHVEAPNIGSWRTGTLRCERAPEGAVWTAGDALPLTRIPRVAAALTRKVGAPTT